jgi:hypothetical protein
MTKSTWANCPAPRSATPIITVAGVFFVLFVACLPQASCLCAQ